MLKLECGGNMTIREYRKMSNTYKNGLKREYKLRNTDDYYYAWKLKGLLLVGISFAIIALLYALKYNLMYGMILVALFILYCFYILLLIHKSNKEFEKFLNNLSRNKKSD